jgi:hypothetical protein
MRSTPLMGPVYTAGKIEHIVAWLILISSLPNVVSLGQGEIVQTPCGKQPITGFLRSVALAITNAPGAILLPSRFARAGHKEEILDVEKSQPDPGWP